MSASWKLHHDVDADTPYEDSGSRPSHLVTQGSFGMHLRCRDIDRCQLLRGLHGLLALRTFAARRG